MNVIKNIKRSIVVLFGGTIIDRKEIKEAVTDVLNNPRPVNDGLKDIYLFDFKKGYQSGFDNPSPFVMRTADAKKVKPRKIKVKPIDVLNELETVPTPFSLELIDEKVEMLKDKAKLIKQEYTKREVEALIERIENRKKYKAHREFFGDFQNTTEEKIEKLLKKHNLEMHEADLFVPEFPDAAIKIMKKYKGVVKKICEKTPVFYVIAEHSDFKKKYQKRDPILLAQSPFGFYYQILGAWDKEMLLLSEL